MNLEDLKVPPEQLTVSCDPDSLGFETTDEVGPLEKTVGQDRALGALEFGLDIDAPGYNIYVAGYPGTGRTTTLTNFLNNVAPSRPVPNDWCYVYDFRDPMKPIAVSLPPGMGRELAQDIEGLIADCRRDIPRAFESDEYRQRGEEAVREIQQQLEVITREIESEAERTGFHVQPSQTGIVTTPVRDGQPLNREQYQELPEEEKEGLRKESDKLQEFINQKLLMLRRLEREATRRRSEVDQNTVLSVVGPVLSELKEKYQGIPRVLDYLQEMRRDLADHVGDFLAQESQVQTQQTREAALARQFAEEERFSRYQINVLVDNSEARGAPVVFEYSPTYYNMFGRLDYRPRFGTVGTDLTMIRPGAIHRANGGYLTVQAKDLLANPGVWETLKRTLRSGEARIENIGEQYSPIPTSTLAPEPIPLNVKIVMVGTPYVFQMLQRLEEDFRKFFKVKADFDLSMDRTPENTRFYAAFICNRCRDGDIRPFHKTAVAKMVQYSSRLVEHQGKLTTRFIDIADLITEANHWATQDGQSPVVTAEHISKAIEERIFRSNLPEERIHELINDGTIKIDTTGEVIGQVNGMSVLDMGDHTFGRPLRITTRTSMGRGQVAHIDRETQMTGRIHNKGFLTLTGYLMGKFGQDRLLNFRSTIGFEQTYDEVEGDSASSAELYALLSSLSGLPINQGIAVTGSVNQRGDVQAIGGATYKIEGFFDVCKAQGLTGNQGVVIPSDNIKNLVLRDEVVQAVRDGKFTIYAVNRVGEGIQILTGVSSGEPDANGEYPEGTVNYQIAQKFEYLASKAKENAARSDSRDGAFADDGFEEERVSEKALLPESI
jgi:lon-related putative ATP-dependent protease